MTRFVDVPEDYDDDRRAEGVTAERSRVVGVLRHLLGEAESCDDGAAYWLGLAISKVVEP